MTGCLKKWMRTKSKGILVSTLHPLFIAWSSIDYTELSDGELGSSDMTATLLVFTLSQGLLNREERHLLWSNIWHKRIMGAFKVSIGCRVPRLPMERSRFIFFGTLRTLKRPLRDTGNERNEKKADTLNFLHAARSDILMSKVAHDFWCVGLALIFIPDQI